MSDKACHFTVQVYNDYSKMSVSQHTDKKRAEIWDLIQLSLEIIWSEQTITDSYVAEKKKKTWNTNSALRGKIKQQQFQKNNNKIINDNLNYSNNSDSLT